VKTFIIIAAVVAVAETLASRSCVTHRYDFAGVRALRGPQRLNGDAFFVRTPPRPRDSCEVDGRAFVRFFHDPLRRLGFAAATSRLRRRCFYGDSESCDGHAKRDIRDNNIIIIFVDIIVRPLSASTVIVRSVTVVVIVVAVEAVSGLGYDT